MSSRFPLSRATLRVLARCPVRASLTMTLRQCKSQWLVAGPSRQQRQGRARHLGQGPAASACGLLYVYWAHDPCLSQGLLPRPLGQASQQRELQLGSSAGAPARSARPQQERKQGGQRRGAGAWTAQPWVGAVAQARCMLRCARPEGHYWCTAGRPGPSSGRARRQLCGGQRWPDAARQQSNTQMLVACCLR